MMKKYFTLVVCFLLTQFLFANDILIPFGQTNTAAPQWKYKGGGTNLDGTSWRDLSYTEIGWLTGKSALVLAPILLQEIPTYPKMHLLVVVESPEQDTLHCISEKSSTLLTLQDMRIFN